MFLSNRTKAVFHKLSHERCTDGRTQRVFLRKYNNRLQTGRSLRRPAQSVVSSLNHSGV